MGVPELQSSCGLLAVNISHRVLESYVSAVSGGKYPLLHSGGGGGSQGPCPHHYPRGASQRGK